MWRFLATLVCVNLLLVGLSTTTCAGWLDPVDFSSLGILDLSNASYTIDTDSLTIVDDAAPGTPLFTGVVDDQGGTADFVGGVWVPGSMGIPEIAVFTFDDIDIQSTANITVTGTRALAFLSHGNVSGSSGGAASFVGDNSVGGNLSMAADDSLAIRLGSATPSQFDSLVVGGDATLAGSLSVSLAGGFTLTASQSFTIVDVAGTTFGSFAGLAEGTLIGSFGGTDLFITYTGGNGNDVALFTAGLPGDFDFDLDVDGNDFLLWQIDPNVGKLSDWETNYGTVLPPPLAAASVAVPEPSALALLSFAALLFLRRQRNATAGATPV